MNILTHPLKIWGILTLYCLALNGVACLSASAQDAPTLSIARSESEVNFTIISASNASGCLLELYGSRSRRKLKSDPDQGTLIGSTYGNISGSTLTASNISRVRRNRRTRSRRVAYYTVVYQSCSGATTQSKIKRLRIKTARGKSLPRIKNWLNELADQTSDTSLRIVAAFSGLSFSSPVDLQNAGDGSNRLFLAEQGGVIWVFDLDDSTPSKVTFLDLSAQIELSREQGLLGFAFHPDYSNNGYFFVSYVEKDTGDSIIARYKVSGLNANTADSSSELIFLRVSQPTAIHQGGQIAFGPDGFLYIAFGDGGPQFDGNGNGQNRATLLGSLLRIDVDTPDGGNNYSSPASNPFKGNSDGYKEEIFAWGFRNPWRFSFDSLNGTLWLADVGQNSREEIDIVESGKNYGWAITEGSTCLSSSSDCNKDGLEDPVYDYSHSAGSSITGGFVYRGSAISSLIAQYLFADFVSGRIWSLAYDGTTATATQLFDTDLFVSSFGIDESENLYLLSYGSGEILKLVEGSQAGQ